MSKLVQTKMSCLHLNHIGGANFGVNQVLGWSVYMNPSLTFTLLVPEAVIQSYGKDPGRAAKTICLSTHVLVAGLGRAQKAVLRD